MQQRRIQQLGGGPLFSSVNEGQRCARACTASMWLRALAAQAACWSGCSKGTRLPILTLRALAGKAANPDMAGSADYDPAACCRPRGDHKAAWLAEDQAHGRADRGHEGACHGELSC